MTPQQVANALHGFAAPGAAPRRARGLALRDGGRAHDEPGPDEHGPGFGRLLPGARATDGDVDDAFHALERALPRVFEGLTGGGLASLMRGWARCGAPPGRGAVACADSAIVREAHRCNALCVSSLLRSYAALALLPSRRAAEELEARVPECCFVHSEAADALHAYATLGLRPKARALEFLLAKLAAPALPAGRVARALWACAVLGLEAPTELVDAANGIPDVAPADVPRPRLRRRGGRAQDVALVPSLLGDSTPRNPPPSLGAACAALGRGRGADGVVAGAASPSSSTARRTANDGGGSARRCCGLGAGLAVVSIREADWEASDDQVALLKARMEEAAVERRWSPRRRRFSVALAETIEKEFTGQVTVTQVGDPGTTGNFEVTVAGKLVHSKTTMGHDKCQSGESTQKVIDAIQEAVDA
ncbi:hypothetical protein JL721_7324 [Aureococcus anophagefferens]|nr:hypothetical protein JL721_7324 [Aureococcus anophagefferens]